MSNIAIRAENLSKKYHIGKQEKYKALRDTLTDAFKAPFRRAGKLLRGQAYGAAGLDEIIWALKDISFDIKQGEVVGVIGRNGAGKSTLLKIFTRITEPTEGFAEIRGRIRALLEVGTGFHPELTGRENIYLNGAILGMKRTEIISKFDEIVNFAEVERFVDTPVKHYSSGMYLRLAFAVAAHLESEILIVDEVLAVGDAQFQSKCIDKMEDVGQGGRTVIFVSHNMSAITRLCKRVILLNEGCIINDGPSHQIVSEYINPGSNATAEHEWPDPIKAPGGDIARLRAVRVKVENGQISDHIDIRKPVTIEMEFDVIKPDYLLLPGYQLFNETGLEIFATDDLDPAWRQRTRPVGRFVSSVVIPGNFLSEGTHFVRVSMFTRNPFVKEFVEPNVVAFNVVDSFEGDSARGDWPFNFGGVIRPLLNWTNEFKPNRK